MKQSTITIWTGNGLDLRSGGIQTDSQSGDLLNWACYFFTASPRTSKQISAQYLRRGPWPSNSKFLHSVQYHLPRSYGANKM